MGLILTKQRKTVQQGIRFSPAMWKALEMRSGRLGVSPRELVRQFCLSGLKGERGLQFDPDAFKALLQELRFVRSEVRRIGVNVNQITTAVNYGKAPDVPGLEIALSELNSILAVSSKEVGKVINEIS